MANNKLEVEVVPWFHQAGLKAHEEVVFNFIRKLPKNSELALEISPDNLTGYSSILKQFAYNEFWSDANKEVWEGIGFDDWAIFEILHECEKRNIKVIPVETTVARKKYAKRLDLASYGRDALEADLFKEKTYVRNLLSALKGLRRKQIPLIVGSAHAESVVRELNDVGLNAKIKIDIFSKKHKMKKILGLISSAREAALENKGKLANRFWNEVIKTTNKDFRAERYEEFFNRIVGEQAKMTINARERIFRKKNLVENKKANLIRKR